MKYKDLTAMQRRLLSGSVSAELQPIGTSRPGTEPGPSVPALRGTRPMRGLVATTGLYLPRPDGRCAYRIASAVNADQDCQNITDADLSGRAQAQNNPVSAQDHTFPGRLLVTANDYRRGDGNCFGYFSADGGRTFGDAAVPMGFTRGGPEYANAARQYWGTGSDPSAAFDTVGNAYYSCLVLNRGLPVSSNPDLSSALLVARSPANGGASYTFPGRVAADGPDVRGQGTATFVDSPNLTADDHLTSPFRDRVYITWSSPDPMARRTCTRATPPTTPRHGVLRSW